MSTAPVFLRKKVLPQHGVKLDLLGYDLMKVFGYTTCFWKLKRFYATVLFKS